MNATLPIEVTVHSVRKHGNTRERFFLRETAPATAMGKAKQNYKLWDASASTRNHALFKCNESPREGGNLHGHLRIPGPTSTNKLACH